MQQRQPLLIGRRSIHYPAVYLYPGVGEERRGAITNHQPRIHAMLSQQPDGTDGPLQAQHRLPVETARQQDRVANGPFQLITRRLLRYRLLSQLPQQAPAAAPFHDGFVAHNLVQRSDYEGGVSGLFHNAASLWTSVCRSSSLRKLTT